MYRRQKNGSAGAFFFTAEQAPGGHYNTWLCDWRTQQSWHDIDPAVNANVAFMLRNLDIQLSGLTQYLTGLLGGELQVIVLCRRAPLLYFWLGWH